MNGATLFQVQLLLSAIGNAIDDNPNVEHITLPEIWEWLNDIMGMQEWPITQSHVKHVDRITLVIVQPLDAKTWTTVHATDAML